MGFGGGYLGCTAPLSAPVTLTLTLSRRAGEGKILNAVLWVPACAEMTREALG